MMRYIPFHKLGKIPNIIVDGSRSESTLIILSHWPQSGTPKELKDDLSVQIAFKYLENPKFHVKADVVSNNHFDEDGLTSMYAILKPEHALENKELLIDIGRAGDFGTYRTKEAARITFVLSAYADPDLTPLSQEIFQKQYQDIVSDLYNQMLELLPDIISNPERFKRYWKYEEEMLNASEAAIMTGKIKIEEIPSLDLAIVTLPDELPERKAHRFTMRREATCHPMALYNATNCCRILLMQKQTYEFEYRYESWVQYISRKIMPRVDLTPLADKLSEEEGNANWEFEGVDKITPKLHLVGATESKIPQEKFKAMVTSFLEGAKPAWDPFDK